MSALAPCRHHCSLGRVLLALCLAASMSFARAALPVAADDFEDLAPWRADAADGVGARLRAVPGADGSALRLDYDFAGAGGYAFVRRELPTELPENFEITFRVRGSALRNHFEIKLVDASGDNVWWHARRDHAFAGEWQTWRIKRRQIDFAWGPAADRTLRRFQRIEFVVAAGRDGGAGHVEIDSLRIDQVPVPRTAHAPLRASASSKDIVCSQVEMVLPAGAFMTTIPCSVAAGISTLSSPTPARPITLRFVPAAIISLLALVALRTKSAS